MTNEQNYTIVLLKDPNTTDDFPCPRCGNNDIDLLGIDCMDNVECLECGCQYSI